MGQWPPPTGRGPAGRSAGLSPRNTSSGFSRSTRTRKAPASGPPCSAAKEYTPPAFPNGAGPATPRPGRKSRKAGPAARPGQAAEAENERLRRENEKLAAELARTKAALEIVGKAHALLELLSESADSEKKPRK